MTMHQPSPLYPMQYENSVRAALAEDLGRGPDLTTDAVVAVQDRGRGSIVSRAGGVVAGTGPAKMVFRILDPGTVFGRCAADGDPVVDDQPILEIDASTRTILNGERTALNFLGRLCGVATLTRAFVEAVRDTSARIVCTRKTTPGLRLLEKYAVRCGGGWNHRFGLDDAVLIKDNHLVAAGGVAAALESIRERVGHTVKIELEVDTLDQLEEALSMGVDAVLLDNMDAEKLCRAVAMADGRVITEASGGITLQNVSEIAATGVDLISVGALTHSAPSLDISLELEKRG